MKAGLPLIIAITFSVAASTFSADPEIPPGVVYKRADEATNAAGREAVKAAFSAGAPQVLAMMGKGVSCGPAYWSMIKEDPTIRDLKRTSTMSMVPNTSTGKSVTLAGAAFNVDSAKAAFAARLAADIGKTPTIRKLNADELRVYWALIVFDIEEPLFILESNGKHFLIHLIHDKDGFSIFWVDELSSYKFSK